MENIAGAQAVVDVVGVVGDVVGDRAGLGLRTGDIRRGEGPGGRSIR